MTRPAIALLVLLAGAPGCPSDNDDDDTTSPTPPGEVAVIDVYSRKIGLIGTTLYRNVTSDVRALDVSNPADAVDGSEVDSQLSCSLDCEAFVVDRLGEAGYLLDPDEISKVTLSGDPFVDWIYTLPEAVTYIPHDLAVVTGPGVAVSRYFFDPPAVSSSGDIVLIDATASQATRIYTDFLPVGVESDGGPLLTYSWRYAGAGTNQVVAYDVSSMAAPVELGRFPVSLPGNLRIDSVAVSGTDLAITSSGDGLGDVGCFIAWYRFAPDFSALVFVGSTTRYVPRIASVPRFYGGMLLAGVSQDCGEPSGAQRSTVILAVGTGTELAETARIGARSFPYALEIDESRDLLFVGGDVLQVVDLDDAIGGVPAQ